MLCTSTGSSVGPTDVAPTNPVVEVGTPSIGRGPETSSTKMPGATNSFIAAAGHA